MGNHRWVRSGGCRENPGIWSKGTHMVVVERCERCGSERSREWSIIRHPDRMERHGCHGWQYDGDGPGQCRGSDD